jgi:hypothetical protein
MIKQPEETSTMNNLPPVAVDLIYLERLAALSRAGEAVEKAAARVLNEAGKQVYVLSGRYGRWVTIRREVTHLAVARGVTEAEAAPYILEVPAALAEGLAPRSAPLLADAEAARAAAREACRECEDEYDRRPWARYWLVVSSDGHIHRSRHCSTCNKGQSPTRFALAAYLSGKPVEEAVADLGPALCSVCFPDAPVESKEQARISSRLALTLAEEGCEAFQKARKEAAAKLALRCPGSGQQAKPGAGINTQKCPVCGEWQRAVPSGKVRPHKPARFIVRQRYGSKCWTGSAWGTAAKAAIYSTREEAATVAGQVSTPEESAEACRK